MNYQKAKVKIFQKVLGGTFSETPCTQHRAAKTIKDITKWNFK